MPITGANAKRVLFGAINLRTAHRVVLIRPRAGAADAQAFLREIRRRYRTAGTIWLLADRASAHTAARTQMLAAALGIRFLWLPKQAPELNAMDQLWRELKRLIAANRQAASVNALASNAAGWVLRTDTPAGAPQGRDGLEALLAQEPGTMTFGHLLSTDARLRAGHRFTSTTTYLSAISQPRKKGPVAALTIYRQAQP